MKTSEHQPGIKDIARLSGVSIGTVDRVLHKRGRVAQETAKKVLKIAAELEYKPNLMARGLAGVKPRKIALLMPETSDEYWQQAMSGALSAGPKWEQAGISIVNVFYSESDVESFSKAANEILGAGYDGIVAALNFTGEGKQFVGNCKQSGIPIVLFDTPIPDTSPLAYAGTDSYNAGRLAAELLTLTGSRKGRFVIVHFDEDAGNSPHMTEKEKGFISWLKKESAERKYMVLPLNSKRNTYTDQLDILFSNNRVSGIFVTTSRVYRIARYLDDKKINDISLVGFDLVSKNIRYLKSGHIQFLINQNPGKQAAECINLLSNYLVYSEKPAEKVILPNEIVTKSLLPLEKGKLK
jgi:LacI family transcriptional regulator